ncbi:hypothetical protein [Nonomuraea sp. NPDC049480]|uniref:hypothetical protein n=1 Tax=Nonomuraea sp. NPDC049480 TaxID=3364353 RepID=UPI0037AA2E95
MTRSGPFLTLLMGMATIVALAALSISMLPAPRSAADATTSASAEPVPTAEGGPAAEADPPAGGDPTDPPAGADPSDPPAGADPSDPPAGADPTADADPPAEDDPPAGADPSVEAVPTDDADPPAGDDPPANRQDPTNPSASASPRQTAAAKSIDYAGRVQGRRGLLAISLRGTKAVGYFCDGKTEVWFKGTVSNGQVSLKGAENAGDTVTAEVDGTRLTGEMRIGTARSNFSLSTVRKPSGLYRATATIRGANLQAGWIYLNDGTRVGAVTLDGVLIRAQIPEPGELTVIKGVAITPKDVDEFMGGS